MSSSAEEKLQRDYYARTAEFYDSAHLQTGESHDLASRLLEAAVDHYDFRSILDVGAGTGRTLRTLRQRFPDRTILGIEPVAEMRAIGHRHGLPEKCLVEGNATKLAFPDGSFDVVSAFGVLHHVPDPSIAVKEMMRVARRAIYISDANRFAQGGTVARRIKRWTYCLGLWPTLQYLRTRGRGYSYSEGDGVAYSYSVFDNYRQIASQCVDIHLVSLNGHGPNLIYGAAQVGLLALKRAAAPAKSPIPR